MASKNVKVEVKITNSPNADYSDPAWVYEGVAYEMDPEAVEFINGLQIGTGAETLMRTDRYTSLLCFYVKNLDTSNYLTLVYTSTLGVSRSTKILAGADLLLSDVDPATSPTLQANGASVLCDIIMGGES